MEERERKSNASSFSLFFFFTLFRSPLGRLSLTKKK
jgi:hypothetical protein